MHTRVFQSDCAENRKILVLFYKNDSVFSNFHPADFTVKLEKDVHFTCSEQFFMYKKALFVGDQKIAKKILQETDPMKMKMLGRSLQMSKRQLADWSRKSRDEMYRACYEKFSQNEKMRQMLFRTHGMKLVEASPTDKIWGIGLSNMDRRARNLKEWKGSNWLGEVLDRVRDELWNESRFRSDILKIDDETLTTRCLMLESLPPLFYEIPPGENITCLANLFR